MRTASPLGTPIALLLAGPALRDGRLWVRALKITADGALGSRGAALLEDYSDEPGNRGAHHGGLGLHPAAGGQGPARRA